MYSTRLFISALVTAATLAACGGRGNPAPTAAAPQLQTVTVGGEGAAAGAQWDGVVQAVEQAVISAQTSGRITQLPADVDQRVVRGAVLARISAEEQSAAAGTALAQLRAAEAMLVDAEARFRRASDLVGRRLISQDEFDRVKAAHDAGVAQRDAAAAVLAQARQQLAYTTVQAPYAGVVAARHVEIGEAVAPGRPLFTLYAPGALRLEVQLPQGDAEAIRARPEAEVTLPDGQQVAAQKVIVYPSADPEAHSTTVRVLLPALATPPRPGQTAKVRFAAGRAGVGSATAVAWVPAGALVTRGELSAVYVVREDSVVMRQVRPGRQLGDRVEVVAGLASGEQVAVDPVAALQYLKARQAGGAAAHD